MLWKQVHEMVGLESVKSSVKELTQLSESNSDRQLQGKSLITTTLNRVILGPPGTGKSTVAEIYGSIIGELGFLSNGEAITNTPAGFIGQYTGNSEANTRDILSATVGKVFIIEDAHMLYQTDCDRYRRAVIDTLLSNIYNQPLEDRCIILLAKIFELMVAQDHCSVTEEAQRVVSGSLTRASHRPNFSNAGEVVHLLSRAKTAFNARVNQGFSGTMCLEPQDFDADYNRPSQALSHDSPFSNMVGMQDIANVFRNYQRRAENMRLRGIDSRELIPLTFTTTARFMGKVFYDMGLLATSDVVECSVTDMVGEYTGHTGMTNSRYKGKMAIILARYTLEMNRTMQSNPGLRFRFFIDIEFPNMTPESCLSHLEGQITRHEAVLMPPESDQEPRKPRILQLFSQISRMRS
ncbi:hypothetical protein BJX99DRAFT_249577 [Aspergillus californicus]